MRAAARYMFSPPSCPRFETASILSLACMHADSDFLHLGGSELSYCPICTAAVAARSPGTGVSLKSCSFRLPFEAPGSRYIRAFAGGLAPASHTLCLSVNPGLILACVKYMHGCERMHVLYMLLKGRADAVISDSPLGVELHALSCNTLRAEAWSV